jgi:hypothetical protein
MVSRSQPSSIELCKFCGNPPGQKVGPPALARCVTPGCAGTKLAAFPITEWNERNAALPHRSAKT